MLYYILLMWCISYTTSLIIKLIHNEGTRLKKVSQTCIYFKSHSVRILADTGGSHFKYYNLEMRNYHELFIYWQATFVTYSTDR